MLEKLVVKSLYSKLGLKYEGKEGHPFAEYVKEANDAKEEKGGKENDTHRYSSNQQSPETKAFQQSSLSHMEMQEEVWAHLGR